jgi:CubicO group peptidase (beta-lactamase class C family)
MAEEGQFALDTPVQQLLGDSITMPKGKREITLVDLSTHSSGLPGLPSNFAPRDMGNPYVDYSVEQLGKFLAGHKLAREPGAKYEYSNLGVGLLGHALALKSGCGYEELVRRQVCGPLGMDDTCVALDVSQQNRLAQGHDADGTPVANWDLPTLAGAGALRSTAHDMLRFLAANLHLHSSPLAAAVKTAQAVHFESKRDVDDLGLGWHLRRGAGVVWHNGGTGGYRSFAAIVPSRRAGVVVLANTASEHVDALGFRLVRLIEGKEVTPPKLSQPIELDAAALTPLVGDYQFNVAVKAKISQREDQLFVQLTGQQPVRLYPESPRRFFCRVVDAAITFEGDEQITALVLHQGGVDQKAARE